MLKFSSHGSSASSVRLGTASSTFASSSPSLFEFPAPVSSTTYGSTSIFSFTPSSSSGSLFGSSASFGSTYSASAPPSTATLFGSSATFGFGSTYSASAPPSTSYLFGSSAPLGFGSTYSASAPPSTSNLFGSSAPFGSTYSASAPPSLFGTSSLFDSAGLIQSSPIGSSSSAPSSPFLQSESTSPAHSSLFGSGSTPVSISFVSSSAAPNAAATAAFFGSGSCPTYSSGTTTTTATIGSLISSIIMLTRAASSVSESPSTVAPPSIGNSNCSDLHLGLGDDEIGSEAKQVSERVEKVPIDQMEKIGQDNDDEKRGTMVGGQDYATSSMDPTTRIIDKEVTVSPANVHVATTDQITIEANTPLTEAVDDEVPENSSENSSTESEVSDGDKISHPAYGSLASLHSSPCADFEELALILQNSSPSRYVPTINQILDSYGDISQESILKSMEAKAAFFQLLAKVIEQLRNHTIESLDSGEWQLMQMWVDDAEAVGFKVNWLQQRLKSIVAYPSYQKTQMQINKLGEQIDAAEKALAEMELQRKTLKEEADAMKVELDAYNFNGSNLCEGLF